VELSTAHVPGRCREEGPRMGLLDGGSTPPPYEEDDPIVVGTMAPMIGKDKGTCRAPRK
jgi:hypothetical protein